uniref:Uncharacterized protein n=1 Tax=Vespula pensylvanica TaxID=30213 RepID=A0A834NXH0_VESPE|nr:hypothetical protein H0235_010700 [Vespula pensylvanica]
MKLVGVIKSNLHDRERKHFPNENEKGKGRARVTTRPSKNDGVLRKGELVRSDSQHLDVLAPSKHRLSVHRDEIVGNIRDERVGRKVVKKRGNYGKGCGLRAMGESGRVKDGSSLLHEHVGGYKAWSKCGGGGGGDDDNGGGREESSLHIASHHTTPHHPTTHHTTPHYTASHNTTPDSFYSTWPDSSSETEPMIDRLALALAKANKEVKIHIKPLPNSKT